MKEGQFWESVPTFLRGLSDEKLRRPAVPSAAPELLLFRQGPERPFCGKAGHRPRAHTPPTMMLLLLSVYAETMGL